MAPVRRPRHWKRWVIGGVVVVLVVVVGGPFVYFHFIEGSAAVALQALQAEGDHDRGPARRDLDRRQRLAGRVPGPRDAVRSEPHRRRADHRSDRSAERHHDRGDEHHASTVDMTQVSSDSGERDGQFQGRIMDTSQFPTAKFTLTTPIDLGTTPTPGVDGQRDGVGLADPARHDPRRCRVPISARQTGNTIQVTGSIPVTFSDYNIDNPSGGPASVGDSGTVEFLLTFRHA